MQISQIENRLKILCHSTFGFEATEITALPLSGSERRYFRMYNSEGKTIIAVYNNNIPENESFYYFSEILSTEGFKVPEIFSISEDRKFYIIEDLGDHSLLNILEQDKANSGKISINTIQLYKNALNELAKIQVKCQPLIDYSKCFQHPEFNKKSMLDDCMFFKYWYLYPIQATYDETALENDFEEICNYLYDPDNYYFMYRDFQARNIMVKNKEPYFIDFQGGRKGPLQYDVASLLFQAKAALPDSLRNELLEFYLDRLEELIAVDRDLFKARFDGFVLLRSMQVLGAYGFKGFFQKKEHFLSSIPYALKNISHWLKNSNFPLEIPELRKLLLKITAEKKTSELKKELQETSKKILKLHIRSFSYKKGLPDDVSGGHGQGYVFDCRIIHNPGRYDQFKKLSGLDKEVKDFLNGEQEMHNFLKPVFDILVQAVNKFIERDFEYLGINFGCTGGQHRSVFAAEKTANFLKEIYHNNVEIIIEHREKLNWKK